MECTCVDMFESAKKKKKGPRSKMFVYSLNKMLERERENMEEQLENSTLQFCTESSAHMKMSPFSVLPQNTSCISRYLTEILRIRYCHV